MKLHKGILDFFRSLAGTAAQMKASGRLQPIVIKDDNPVAVKRRELKAKQKSKEGSWGKTQFLG